MGIWVVLREAELRWQGKMGKGKVEDRGIGELRELCGGSL